MSCNIVYCVLISVDADVDAAVGDGQNRTLETKRESVRKKENTKIDFQIPTQIFSIFKTVRSFNFKPRVINILQTI